MGARSTPNPYNPATDPTAQLVAGTTTALSDFWGFVNDCGETGAEIIYGIYKGVAPTGAHLNSVVQSMLSNGTATNRGVTTPGGIVKLLGSEGIPATTSSNWLQALQQNVPSKPVELLVEAPGASLGKALPGDEFGVQGHFFTVVGWSQLKQAWIVADGDNASGKQGQFNYYTTAQLQAANPVSAIIPVNTPSASSGIGAKAVTGTNVNALVNGSSSSSGGPSIPILSGVAQLIAGAAGAAVGGATSDIGAVLGNLFQEAGWLILALALVAIGGLMLVWPAVGEAVKQAPKVAEVAAA